MPATADLLETARSRAVAAISGFGAALQTVEGPALGEGLIQAREMKDQLEAVFVEGLGRFDRSGEYAADGAIDLVSWLRSRCRVSGGDAAQRVGMARQLQHLPETQKAFATGELGFQHVAVLARAAEHVGAAALREAEASLVKLAQAMDPGEFTGAVKSFEHQVDAEAMLADANRAHERRYIRLSDRSDGMIRVDGLLDAEGGAIVRTTLNAAMLPGKGDRRTPDQRRADALVEACRGTGATAGSRDGSGPRPQLIIRATVDTLAGIENAPAGQIDGGGVVPAETVRRFACDSAVIRITGKGELDGERTHAARTIPPTTRRALGLRDGGCAAEHCKRPPSWTDAHHIKHWAHGGPTTMGNLVLLCRPHHRMVHEEGWGLQKLADGRWALLRPLPRARSA